ncbi:MAG: hypothetical protein KDI88_04820 [Gammaproteobacteria bacterium]|nr:hypothetical protein [Gammaproteobacteria bacterium]
MQAVESDRLIEQTVFRGLVWALVGVIFALVFVVAAEALRFTSAAPHHLLIAATGSAALTALFYGSMRLTVMTANFTFIAMLVYTWASHGLLALEPLVLVGASVGVVVGTLYGWRDKKSRIFCAEAKIVAGIVSGLLAGSLALAITYFVPAIGFPWLTLVVAPASTLIYVSVAHWFVKRCHHWLPAVANGAIVGLGVGAVTGLFFMVMAGALDPNLLASVELQAFVGRVEAQWPGAVFGCAAVNFLVGAARSVMKVPWYNL